MVRKLWLGCRPAELVDSKRKRRDNPSSDDDDLESDVNMGGEEGDTRLFDAKCPEMARANMRACLFVYLKLNDVLSC